MACLAFAMSGHHHGSTWLGALTSYEVVKAEVLTFAGVAKSLGWATLARLQSSKVTRARVRHHMLLTCAECHEYADTKTSKCIALFLFALGCAAEAVIGTVHVYASNRLTQFFAVRACREMIAVPYEA